MGLTARRGTLFWLSLVGMALLSAAIVAAGHVTDTRPKSKEPWAALVLTLEDGVTQGEEESAMAEWLEAYRAALGSRRWEGMVAVGDIAVRIRQTGGARGTWEPRARRAYLSALLRARQQNSLEGVLRAAEGFASLGDRQVVQQALAVATALAAGSPDPSARARIHDLRGRMAATPTLAAQGYEGAEP